MKIIHITNNYYPSIGGVETFVKELAEKMQEKGIQNSVLALNSDHEGKKFESEEINHIKVTRIPFLDLKYYKINPFIFNKIKHADLIICHGLGFFTDYLLLTKPLHKKKIVVFTHGGIFHTKNIALIKKIYFGTFQKTLLKNAELILADSHNDLEIFKKICGKNLVLFEIGLNTSRFNIGKKIKNQFLYIGRISKNKRINLILTKAKELFKDGGKLVIAGRDFDNLVPELKLQAKKSKLNKKIKILGEVNDKEKLALLSKSDYYVSASEYEGFGLTLIEAMASGCIPLVQNNDSFKRIIEDKKDGFLVDFENLTAKEICINSKNKEKMRKNAIKKSKKYDLDIKVNELIEILKKL